MNRTRYRLSKAQKSEIAQNLIDILEKDAIINKPAILFVDNWIRQIDLNGEKKVFKDVWDIVLKNYLPTTRPTLYRACKRIGRDGEIVSFTSSFECAKRIRHDRNTLIICDTKEELDYQANYRKPGNYTSSFYPLSEVLIKAKALGGWGFSEKLLNDYLGEDEYIMRIDSGYQHSFKWRKN